VLSTEQMNSLKKVNISKDADKSKTRITEDFKTTTSENKTVIVDLSGLERRTFYNTFKKGNATAKIVLAMAQILDVSPYYYTGETDEKESCSIEILKRFLTERGYDDIAANLEIQPVPRQKRKYNKKPKEVIVLEPSDDIVDTPIDEPTNNHVEPCDNEEEDIICFEIDFADDPDMCKAVEDLNYDEAALLLQTLFIRAKANSEAHKLAEIVKRCLLA